MNREEWLNAAVKELTPWIEHECGRTLPPVSVTCGWPSTGGTARTRRVIGQCWDAECSADGKFAVFISPVLEGLGEAGALATLVHELLHALVGVECKHKGPFAKAAKAVGLLGKPTATVAGQGLQDEFTRVVGVLGDYPHAVLTPKAKEKKDGTRMLKLECQDCGFVCRTTRKWLDQVGPPLCQCNGTPMLADEDSGEAPSPKEQAHARKLLAELDAIQERETAHQDREREEDDARLKALREAPLDSALCPRPGTCWACLSSAATIDGTCPDCGAPEPDEEN